MKISLLQLDVAWNCPIDNFRSAERCIESSPVADVYVLPEMFSTGFTSEPEVVGEPEDGPALQWMKSYSHKMNAAICGSVAVRTSDNGCRNRFYFVMPNGDVTFYDKHHLFSYGGEPKHYQAGDQRVIVEFRGVRFCLAVCYDLRFPTWLRNREDYDVLLVVASWPTPRISAWSVLLRARAIENQCYVCGVNRVGADPVCQYSGASAIIDAYGRTVAEDVSGGEAVVSAVLDLDKLASFRLKFPVLKDRDL